MPHLHARRAGVNLSSNVLSIENVKEELVAPRHTRLRNDKAKPLIMQEFIRLGDNQGATK